MLYMPLGAFWKQFRLPLHLFSAAGIRLRHQGLTQLGLLPLQGFCPVPRRMSRGRGM